MSERRESMEDHRSRGEGVELKLYGTFLTCRRFYGVDADDAIWQGPPVTLQGDDLSSFHLFSDERRLPIFSANLPTNYFFDEEGNPLPEGTEVTLCDTDLHRLCLRDKEYKPFPKTIVVTLRVASFALY